MAVKAIAKSGKGFLFEDKDFDALNAFLKKYTRAVTSKIILPAQRNAMTIVSKDLRRRIRNLKSLPSSSAREGYAKAVITKGKVYRRNQSIWTGVGIASGSTGGFTTKKGVEVSAQDWSKLSHLFEFGVKPHEITPKRRNTLMFEGLGGAATFSKSVKHPGIKAEPHIRPAMRNNVNRVEAKFRTKLYEMFAKKADVIARAEGLKRAR